MNKSEFIPGENDSIGMVNRHRACHPGGEPMILMSKQQAMNLMLKASRKQPRKEEAQQPEVTREKLILQLCHGLVPISIGLTWVLGAMEGLADPLFTCFVAGISVLWGCVEWKWGKVNA